jgi:hypothetical protein
MDGTTRVAERNINIAFPDKTPSGKDSLFLFSSFQDPHIEMQLPFFRLTKEARKTKITNGLPILRHPSFEDLRNNHRKKN